MRLEEMKVEKPESYRNLIPIIIAAIAFMALIYAYDNRGQDQNVQQQSQASMINAH